MNRWLRLARDRVQFQGLPARICWLGYGERAEMGEAINELVTQKPQSDVRAQKTGTEVKKHLQEQNRPVMFNSEN